MKKTIRRISNLISITILALILLISACKPKGTSQSGVKYLPEGEKIEINKNYNFVYEFNKKPSIGTIILKIKVTDMDEKVSTSFRVTGDSGMPSMKGHHETGEVDFQLNKKGTYLLPVNVVMPGDWAIRIKIYKEKKKLFDGSVGFDI